MPAVVFNLRQFSFTDKKDGITAFLQSVFEAGQSTPLGVCVDRNACISSRKAITNALNNQCMNCAVGFVKKKGSRINQGGAITNGRVTVKVQNHHFYDFPVHHFNVQKPPALT